MKRLVARERKGDAYSEAVSARQFDFRVFGKGAVKHGNVPDGLDDLHLVDPVGQGMGHLAHGVGGGIQHPDFQEFVGIESFFGGRFDSVGEPIFPYPYDRIKVVSQRAEMGALFGGQSVDGTWGLVRRKRCVDSG